MNLSTLLIKCTQSLSPMSKSTYHNLSSFIYEIGLLSRFKRSGFDFLGTGNQNIASHSFRVAVLGYIIAQRVNGANPEKTLMLCLFHDIPETRTGDINYFQKQYVSKNEMKAVEDIVDTVPEMSILKELISLFNDSSSIEAVIARDCDQLELIFTLKEELDKGNSQAEIWINDALGRLRLEESKNLIHAALSMNSYDWWHDILNVKR